MSWGFSLWLEDGHSLLVFTWSSLCTYLCVYFLFLWGHQSDWMRDHTNNFILACHIHRYMGLALQHMNLGRKINNSAHNSWVIHPMGFRGGLVVKNPPANAGDVSSIPGSGKPPGEGNSNPLQYSCLGNPMDRGVWQLQSMGSQKSQTWFSD